MPADVRRYWEGIFSKMHKSKEWQDFVKKNHYEDGFLMGADFEKFSKEFERTQRAILKEAGIKLVR
jgi:tripartite-type tricarboxylate transporter receptor subunit TctC